MFTEEEAGKLGLKVDKHTHYHGLGEDFFLKVIDGLDNVKEAYRGTKNADEPSRRENYFLLVSEFLDQNENTVNVPVYVNEHGQVNRAFIDVNKISTVFGRDIFRDYINRQIQQKNLVRIKNRSTQSSESNALIAKDYRQDASSDSIRENAVDVNQKLSLSSQKDRFPVRKDLDAVRGKIYGSDVQLRELGPVRKDLQTEEAAQDPYDDLPFDMPEGMPEGQLTDEELEADAKRQPVTTVAQRLKAKFASLRQELQTNEQGRKESWDAYDQRIEELQQRYTWMLNCKGEKKMNETVITAKAAIAAFFTALGVFLGWKGVMALVWVLLMAMDWITGVAAARKNGTWKSSIARDGAYHKAGSIVVILLAFLADFIMSIMLPHIPVLNVQWPEFLAPLVLAWYIVTKLGSILENAVKLGAPVPTWIIKIFDATLKMADTVGDKLIDGQQTIKDVLNSDNDEEKNE